MKSIGLFITLLLVVACDSPIKKSATKRIEKKKAEIDFSVKFNPLPKGYAEQYHDSIEAYYNGLINEDRFNGMFLVAKNGQVIFERYAGLANEKNKMAMSAETPIHVASISKTITAIMVMRLVQEKKINIMHPVQHYIPTFPYKDITVRDLLTHRSGLPYYGYFPDSLLPKKRLLSNYDVLWMLKKYNFPLYFPPNTHFSYNNTNYAMLAIIVENVVKMKFPKAIQKYIFDPLKMTHSTVISDTVLPKNAGNSYNSRGVFQEFDQFDAIYGDKNVYTTARDLLLLDKALYSDNFLKPWVKKAMFHGYSYENPGKSNYGLGFRLREEEGKSTFIFHTGWWHGNTGCYAHMQQDTVTMIILSNHYTKTVFGINRLSLAFGNYPFAPLIDTKENYMTVADAKEKLMKR